MDKQLSLDDLIDSSFGKEPGIDSAKARPISAIATNSAPIESTKDSANEILREGIREGIKENPKKDLKKSSSQSLRENTKNNSDENIKQNSRVNVDLNTNLNTQLNSITDSTEKLPEESHEDQTEEQVEEQRIYSVSEINKAIKSQLETEFPIVWLKGEISNFKPHTSGHFYFSLKDDRAQISAVMFKGFNRMVKFKIHDGMEVLVRGKLSVYEPRGSYSINCELMEPVGLGALQLAFEQLKQKLSQEGLFDPKKKRALPALPQRVAIVTSPTGAAIRDMLNVLSRRMKNLEITIFPCAVQGDKAPGEVAAAITLANKIGTFDVMIIGRGGGSIEDLWAFNDERVARAIASSKIPTVSAVGHEIDFTIADFVADLRAPTPSAAAELISKNASELSDKISVYLKTLRLNLYKSIELKKQKLLTAQRRLVDPKRKLIDLTLKVDDFAGRLEQSLQQYLEKQKMRLKLASQKLTSPQKLITFANQKLTATNSKMSFVFQKLVLSKKEKFSRAVAVLDSLSPLKVLDRGYAIVKTTDNKVVKNFAQVKKGDAIKIQVLEGSLEASITKTHAPG